MTSIMRRTVRGTAAGLGALAIVAGTAACGDLLGGGDEGDGDTRTEESQEGESSEGEDSGSGTEEDSGGSEESGDSGTSEESGDSGEESASGSEGEGTGGSGDEGTADSGESEEGGDAAAGSLSEEELTAAGDRFIEFMKVMDDGDGEAACAFFIDPTTDEPLTGDMLTKCGETVAPQMESLEPGSMDMIDSSMVEATDNGDGTVTISMMGSEFPYPMVQGPDGQWYLSLS